MRRRNNLLNESKVIFVSEMRERVIHVRGSLYIHIGINIPPLELPKGKEKCYEIC